MVRFPGKITEVEYASTVPIDTKDGKILYALAQNARLTPTTIGRMVGLSKEVVRYRIDQLVKKGIIRGSVTVINPAKLGFQIFIVYIQTQFLSPSMEKKIIQQLVEHPATHYILRALGQFDIVFDIVASSIFSFDKILHNILATLGRYVKHYETSPIIDVLSYVHLPRSFSKDGGMKQLKLAADSSFTKDLHDRKIQFSSGASIDSTDAAIVSLLALDAQLQLKELGEKCGVSGDAVKYRIKKLIAQNVILSFLPIINLSLLGYHNYGILLELSHTSAEEKQKLLHEVATHPDVLFCLQIGGKHDVALNVAVRDNIHLYHFVNYLKQRYASQIKEVETFLIIQDYKIAFVAGLQE